MGATRADVKSIFGHAMALSSPAERAAYLQQACAGDTELQAEIESLLQADKQAGSFLGERPACAAATTDEPLSEHPGTVVKGSKPCPSHSSPSTRFRFHYKHGLATISKK